MRHHAIRRRCMLLSVLPFAACEQQDDAASFANGAASLKVPNGFRLLQSDHPSGIAVASTDAPNIEVRFVHQSLREQVRINPGASRAFLNGYAAAAGAERLSIGGPSTGALIQAPASIGTGQAPAFESFGAVAFPDAIVTFKVAARGSNGAAVIQAFKSSGLPALLAGLRAAGT